MLYATVDAHVCVCPCPSRAVHNAIFHISNNIRAFAAARLGAAEIDTPGLKEGLPIVEIFRTTPNGGRAVIAAIDCVDGLKVVSKAEWAGLDTNSQPTSCTALIASFAEWLVFCHQALKVKDDMALELLDSRTVLPLMSVSANDFTTAAPWVTTRVRYGGLFGFCQTERDMSIEELLQRAKVRTVSGRRANRRAAKRELKRLKTAKSELEAELQSQRLDTDATAETQELEERLSALAKVERFAKRKLRALARRGTLFIHSRPLEDLRFVDPTAGSVSLQQYESSGGKKGWLVYRPTCREVCYWLSCFGQCHMFCRCVHSIQPSTAPPSHWTPLEMFSTLAPAPQALVHLLLVLLLLLPVHRSSPGEAFQARAPALAADEGGAEAAQPECEAVDQL
eukprot:7389445-Prymnesium_polylepis.2